MWTASSVSYWWLIKPKEGEKMNRPAITLGIVIGITVSVLLLATYILFSAQAGQWGWYMLSLTLAVTGVTTLFGILALPGGLSEDGSYREQRIRFAIAATLLVFTCNN